MRHSLQPGIWFLQRGHGPGLEELPKILDFPFNICAEAETGNFKFSMQLGFAKAHHKNHTQRKKWAWPWAREAPKYWGSPIKFLQWPPCPLSVSGASCWFRDSISQ